MSKKAKAKEKGKNPAVKGRNPAEKERNPATETVYEQRANPLSKGDLWILTAVIIIAIGFYYWQMDDLEKAALYPEQNLVMEIQSPGKGVETIALSTLAGDQDREWELDGSAGGLLLRYEKGNGFSVTSASCPDQLCMGMGTIRSAGQSIVCVPNEIVIRLIAAAQGEERAVDGILR